MKIDWSWKFLNLIKAKYKKIDLSSEFQNLTKAKYKKIYLSSKFNKGKKYEDTLSSWL